MIMLAQVHAHDVRGGRWLQRHEVGAVEDEGIEVGDDGAARRRLSYRA